MADTPLANLIQSFCTSLDDLAGDIKGIAGAYQSANDKFHNNSYNLVTKSAGEVSFYGMGASAFYASTQQSISDTTSGIQPLTDLATAATECHTALDMQTASSDGSIQQAESILDSYRDDLIAIYGDATYPYTQLVDTIAGLDLNSIIQQGRSAVSSAFQGASSQMLFYTTFGINSGEPTYLQNASRAATAINLLTTKIQSICEDWADEVQVDVAAFNNVAAPQPGTGNVGLQLLQSLLSQKFTVSQSLYKRELFPETGKHAKGSSASAANNEENNTANNEENNTASNEENNTANNEANNTSSNEENNKTPFSFAIGPYWQGSAYSTILGQQSGHMGAIPVQNTSKFSVLNAQAGAYIGRNKDGTFNAGLSANASLFDLNDQALVGSKNLGVTAGGDLMGPSANAQLGLKNNTLGADVGVSAATVSGSAGVDVAGVKVGVTGSVGAKLEFGFQIGEKTEIKLPFVSIGFSFSW